MKDRITLAILALALAVVATPVAQALSTPLGALQNCDNVTVGDGAVVSSQTCMGTTGSSIVIQNESASCIRVGGSAVAATTGIQVGDGCAAGQVLSVDAKVVYMISESGDVTGVDVVWGKL